MIKLFFLQALLLCFFIDIIAQNEIILKQVEGVVTTAYISQTGTGINLISGPVEFMANSNLVIGAYQNTILKNGENKLFVAQENTGGRNSVSILQESGASNYASIKQSGENQVEVSQLSRWGKNNLSVLQSGVNFSKIDQRLTHNGSITITQANGFNNNINLEITGRTSRTEIQQNGSNNSASQSFEIDCSKAFITQEGNNNIVSQKIVTPNAAQVDIEVYQEGENNFASQGISSYSYNESSLLIIQDGINNSAFQNIKDNNSNQASVSFIGQIGNGNNAQVR